MNKTTHNHQVNEDLLKKVEGHLDELKNTLLKSGHHVKGDVENLKGKVKNKQADFDTSVHDFNERIKHDVEKARQKVRNEFKHAHA